MHERLQALDGRLELAFLAEETNRPHQPQQPLFATTREIVQRDPLRAEPPREVVKQVVRAAPIEVVREVEVIREVEVVREVPMPGPGTVVVDKPLRSGQQVYARGADLVVMAVVSFGAEVIADGNIHVYAPLRGRAIAGARGNTEARIFSTCLEPQLVSIAGIYRTTETELPAEVRGKPAQVRLEGEKLLIEPLA